MNILICQPHISHFQNVTPVKYHPGDHPILKRPKTPKGETTHAQHQSVSSKHSLVQLHARCWSNDMIVVLLKGLFSKGCLFHKLWLFPFSAGTQTKLTGIDNLAASPVPVIYKWSVLWACKWDNNYHSSAATSHMGAQTTKSFVQLQTMKFANSPTVEMPGFSRNPVLCSIFHLKRTASAGADGPSPCCCAPRFRVDRPRRCLFRSFLKTPLEEPLQTNQIHQLLENDGPRCEINPFNPSLAARNPSEGCGRQNVTLKSKKLLWK